MLIPLRSRKPKCFGTALKISPAKLFLATLVTWSPQNVLTTTSDVIGGVSNFYLKMYQQQSMMSLVEDATLAYKSTNNNQ
jgi:hypothetical protein